jgi:hypothetical protein
MQELLSKIEQLHETMKRITVDIAGVPESQYNRVISTEDITREEIEDRLAFLQSVDANEYHALHYTYHLLAPDVWERYRLYGLHQTPEQVRLKDQKNALRRVWRKKYGPPKNSVKNVGEGNSVGEPVRAEGE